MQPSGRSSADKVERVEIIAEVANAHEGDPAVAQEIAAAALESGADAVKFQVYFAEELLTRSHPRFEHFRRQAFAPDVWRDLICGVAGQGTRVYCDVFGVQALAVVSDTGVYGYKVHSSDLGNDILLDAVAETGRPLLLAAGGSTVQEIARAVSLVRARSAQRLVLMHGFQAYPTAIADAHLERLAWLREIFGEHCELGYADHVDGDDSFSVTLPLLALSVGASVVEKHITLDRSARGVDYYSALDPDGFKEFVEDVRRAEQAFRSDPEAFSDSEREYRKQVKKHWVAARPISAGEALTRADVVMKRTETTGDAPRLEQVLERPLLADKPAECSITKADVRQRVWALVVARMQSSRLPGKALVDVAGRPALAHLFERLKQAHCLDEVVLCTTEDSSDNPLVELAQSSGVQWFRGATEDVLARMLGAVDGNSVDVVVRVTGDDVLVDPEYLDRAVAHHLRENAEYTDLKALPSGTEVEVFDTSLLRILADAAKDSGGTEYLTTYVTDHRDQFVTSTAPVDEDHRRSWRLTLDTAEDLQVVRALVAAMKERDKEVTYRMDDIVGYFAEHPEVLALNADVRHRGTPAEVCAELEWRRLA